MWTIIYKVGSPKQVCRKGEDHKIPIRVSHPPILALNIIGILVFSKALLLWCTNNKEEGSGYT